MSSKLLCLATGHNTGVFALDSSSPGSNRLYVDSETGNVVGFGDMLLEGRDVEMIALPDGACIMPGVADRHTHNLFALVEGSSALSDEQDASELTQLLWSKLEQQPTGTIIITEWRGGKRLSEGTVRNVLDSESMGREVLLLNSSWHSAALSDALLKRVAPRLEAMEGLQGTFSSGVATEDYVIQTLALLDVDPFTLKMNILAREQLLLSRGVTSIYDKMVLGMPLFVAVADLSIRGDLTIPIDAAIQPFMMGAARPGKYGSHFNVRGLKYFADGAFGARNACMCFHGQQSWPYLDDGSEGVNMLPRVASVRRDLLQWREMGGDALYVHAIGPGAVVGTNQLFHEVLQQRDIAAGLTLGFEHMEACPRWVINDVVAMQESGLAKVEVCSQPGFNDDIAAYTDRLPEDVLRMINPYGSFLRGGLKWSFGTDGPITGDRIFGAFAQAVTREGPEAISVSNMLRAAIEQPLEVGKPATFIVVDRDPWGGKLGGTQVLQTWIRGRKVFDRAAAQ